MHDVCTDLNPDLLAGDPCEPDHDLDVTSFQEEVEDEL